MIAPYLLNRMTTQQVKLWAISGERHSAATALAAGLADEVVAADDLMSAAGRWTKRLGRARPHTIAALKTLLAEAAVDPQGSSARGLAALRAALAEPETLARLRRFAETGTPPWEDT
jgi:enoyl-CoA hydratase/carnithine racemase